MNPNWQYELYIDTTPTAVNHTWAQLGGGLENFQQALNEVIKQVQYLNGAGWGESQVLGAAPSITLDGQRKVGNSAQDYIFDSDVQYAFGSARDTYLKIVEPSGRQIVWECTIVRANASGGPAVDGDAVAVEIHTKGAPVITEDTDVIGVLYVVSQEGLVSGSTQLYVNPPITGGNSYVYKTAAYVTLPGKGDDLSSGWTAWNGTDEIAATTGNEIVVAEVDGATLAVKAGKQTVYSLA